MSEVIEFDKVPFSNDLISISIENIVKSRYGSRFSVMLSLKNLTKKTITPTIGEIYYITKDGKQMEGHCPSLIGNVDDNTIGHIFPNLKKTKEIQIRGEFSDVAVNDLLIVQVYIEGIAYILGIKNNLKNLFEVDSAASCIKCGSKQLKKLSYWYWLNRGFFLLILGIIFLIIPIVGLFILFLALLALFVFPFTEKRLICKTCKKISHYKTT